MHAQYERSTLLSSHFYPHAYTHTLAHHTYTDRLISYITYHLGWKVDTGNVEHRNRLAYINTRTHAHTQISGRIEVYMAMRYRKMYINRIKEHSRYHCTITVVSPRTLLVVSDDSTRTIVNKPIRTQKTTHLSRFATAEQMSTSHNHFTLDVAL